MGRDGQSVVEKVRAVLDCYIRDGVYSLSFAALLDATGMSRASLHRTLAEMTENGFLVQAGRARGVRPRALPALRGRARVRRLERLRHRPPAHGAAARRVPRDGRARGAPRRARRPDAARRRPARDADEPGGRQALRGARRRDREGAARPPAEAELDALLADSELERLTEATTTDPASCAPTCAASPTTGSG